MRNESEQEQVDHNQIGDEHADREQLDLTDISSILKFITKQELAEAFVVLRKKQKRLKKKLKLSEARLQALTVPDNMLHEPLLPHDMSDLSLRACKLCGVTFHISIPGVCAAKVLIKFQADDFV